MKKLNKEQQKRLEELNGNAQVLAAELDETIKTFNTTLEEQRDFLQAALDRYNEKRVEIGEFRDEIVIAIEEYVDERSEKWQESEAAGRYETWKSMWEELEVDEVELELPEDIDPGEGFERADGFFENIDTELPG